jgi:mannosyltransferase
MKRSSDRVWYLLVALALVAGAVLRFACIGRQSIWFDEGYTAWLVAHSPSEIIRLVRADTAPPLYYLLLHYWTDLFGRSEAALRSLSALASVLTLILAVDVARRLLSRPIALAAAAWALALCFFAVWFAQEARAYALMSLFIVGSVDCLLCHLQSARRGWLVLAAVLFAAALYTHNMSIAYVATLGTLWLFLDAQPARRRFTDMCIAAAVTAILYVPWVAWNLPRQVGMIHKGFWVHRPSPADVTKLVARLCGIGHFWTWDRWIARFPFPGGIEHGPMLLAILLLGIATILTLAAGDAQRRRQALVLLAAALLPPALVAVYSRVGTPIFMDKIFLPSASLLPICLMLPLAKPSRPGGAVAIVALVLIVASLCGYEHERKNEDWRGATAIVDQLPPAQRLIVFVATEGQLPFDYYSHNTDPRTGAPAGFFDRDPPRTMLRVIGESDLTRLKMRLAIRHYDEVVVVLSHLEWADADGHTLAMLQKLYPFQQTWEPSDADVQVIRMRQTTSGAAAPTSAP